MFTDEFGIKNKIDIKEHIVDIKYNLVLGLETIKENNLTFLESTQMKKVLHGMDLKFPAPKENVFLVLFFTS